MSQQGDIASASSSSMVGTSSQGELEQVATVDEPQMSELPYQQQLLTITITIQKTTQLGIVSAGRFKV